MNETISIDTDSDDASLPNLSFLFSGAKKSVHEINHDGCSMFKESKPEKSDDVGVRRSSLERGLAQKRPLRPRPARKRSYALVESDEIAHEVPASIPKKRKGQKKSKETKKREGAKEDKGIQTEFPDTFKSSDSSGLPEKQASMMTIVEGLISNALHGITYLERFTHQMEQNIRDLQVMQDKQKELGERFSRLLQER